MLSALALAIATLIAVCKFLDDAWLSDTQKRKISVISLRVWNHLDEARRFSFLNSIQGRRARVITAASLSLLLLLWLMAAIYLSGEPLSSYLYALFIPLIMFAVLYAALSFVLVTATPIAVLGRLVAITAIAIVPNLLIGWFYPHGPDVPFRTKAILHILAGITHFVILIWLAVLALLLAIWATSIFLFLSELCVRRIAESPKGVVLGVSAFLGLFGAALKAFGYG